MAYKNMKKNKKYVHNVHKNLRSQKSKKKSRGNLRI